MGMEFRPYYLAREWQKMGHKVRVIAATFSHLRKHNPKIKKDFEIQNVEGVEYQWIKTGTYEGNGVSRAKTMFEFCGKLSLNAARIARSFKPDVVISSSTYPLDTYPAQRIATYADCSYIHEAHDLWPLTLTEIGGMNNSNPFVQLLAVAERSAYSNSDKVVSLFPGAYKHMLKHGLQSRDKFVYIPNGVVLDDWEKEEAMPQKHQELFAKLKNEGRFIVLYLGGHAISNALDVLVDAAGRIKDETDIAFVLVGKGVEKERLIQRKYDEGIDCLYFLPPVGKLQVPAVLQQADALYIGATRSPLYRFGVSMNKVYDYMMSGKPIIYGVEASNNEVEAAQCGITIEPDDPEEIINATKTLQQMSDEAKTKMGNNGKIAVATIYNYNSIAKDFIKIFDTI